MILLARLGRFSSTSCLYGRAGGIHASPLVVRAASGTSNPFVGWERKKVPKSKIGGIAYNKSLPYMLYCVMVGQYTHEINLYQL